jgi:two-component system, NarL family, response regulator NreC
MIRVLIADDHRLVRQCFRALLERDAEVRVVGEAGGGQEALELTRTLRPDIALLDIQMPGLSGLQVARQMGAQSPQTKIVIVTMLADEELVAQALRLGARGYIIKHDSFAELGTALHTVDRGGTYLSAEVTQMTRLQHG